MPKDFHLLAKYNIVEINDYYSLLILIGNDFVEDSEPSD